MTATAIDYYSTQSTLVQNARAGGRGDTLIPHTDSNKVRCYHMKYTAPAGGIAASKVISMGYLPQCLILPSTLLNTTDFGSTGTIDVGFNEYKKNDGTVVAADDNALWDNLDVSGQDVNTSLQATGVATVADGGWPLLGFAEVIVTTATAGMQAAATLDIFFFVVNGQ